MKFLSVWDWVLFGWYVLCAVAAIFATALYFSMGWIVAGAVAAVGCVILWITAGEMLLTLMEYRTEMKNIKKEEEKLHG